MTNYNVRKNMTIPACEEFLREINSSEGQLVLLLPSNSGHSLAGGEASFAQAFCTLARKQAVTTVKTFADNADDAQITKLCSQLFGVCAAINADLVFDKNGVNITKEVKECAVGRVRQLQSHNPYKQNRGTEVQVLCVDHLGIGYPEVFYSPRASESPKLRDRAEFQYVARQIINRLVSDRLAGDLSPEIIAAFGGMLFEIFVNTDEHGRRDLDRQRLMHSIRGVHAKFHSVNTEDLIKIADGYAPLSGFFKSLSPDPLFKKVNFLELSIFDSGIGFASSRTRVPTEDLGLSKELEAISDCFYKGSTSKKNAGYGLGLPRVLKFLRSVGGFLRLRTGRFSLYGDYSDSTLQMVERPDLQVWLPDGQLALPQVEGTLVTLIVPLKRKKSMDSGAVD
ncbi:MAG: hypothetical protein IPJ49_14710 [Candidatus Obscuribacter sp.]|nr:hypothetical protein [Candidatus Obscuribacter sp.]